MKCYGRKRCQEIVARLVDGFWATNRDDLRQKDARIDSDYIKRGSFNSTARVSDQIGLHRQYLKELSGFLLAHLEKDYPHLRPSACESELQETLEREYAGLTRMIPGWLHVSNLLQDNIRSNFEQGLMRDCAEAKAHIRNSCVLWEERWKESRKWYRDPKWIVGIVITVALSVLAVVGPHCLPQRAGDAELASRQPKDLRVDPNTHRTPLYARTKLRVDGRTDYLIREKIHPWLFMTPGSKVVVTLHNGRAFTYSGFEFEGTPRDVFWKNLIDPFLEEAAQQVLDEVGKECRSNDILPTAALKEAGWLLENMVRHVYRKMVDVDQGLRGKGYPESVPKQDVQWEINRMLERVRHHVDAAIALYSAADI